MGDILLPTAFTQAITIILVGQDNAYPTTVLEPFSAIIRTSRLVLKAFYGQITIPNARRCLDSSPRFLIISPRSWKYLVIFSGFVILALVKLNFSGLRIENVGFLLIKPANQSFPEIFWLNCPTFIFFFLQKVPTQRSNYRFDMPIPCLDVSLIAFSIFSTISGGIVVRLGLAPTSFLFDSEMQKLSNF